MPAGYSGTPLPRKLGIKEGHRLLLSGAPADFEATLGALPDGVTRTGPSAGDADVTLLFQTRASKLTPAFAKLAGRMATDGALWVAWPKKASGMETDLSFDVVQRTGLDAGLVDVKICAVDETWSGLKFVIRLENRPRDRPGHAPKKKP